MIRTKEDLKDYMAKDKFALDITRKHPPLFGDEVWKFQIILRKREYYTNCKQNLFTKVMKAYYSFRHHNMSVKLGYQIPANTCGPGLRINHFGLCGVHPNAKLGKFCNIHMGAWIAQNKVEGAAPQIGDNVYIGAGAKILGEVHIANNVVIGANSVVTKDILEEGVTVAGAPARIIKYEGNTWEIEKAYYESLNGK